MQGIKKINVLDRLKTLITKHLDVFRRNFNLILFHLNLVFHIPKAKFYDFTYMKMEMYMDMSHLHKLHLEFELKNIISNVNRIKI